ncbi:MAG: hypothetical protein ACRDA3_14455 [Peptostreptococcaceae bacterium]
MLAENIIIYGTITNQNQKSIYDSVVQIVEINPKANDTRTNLGYTRTDINGYYSFLISISDEKIYQLSIYPPLIKDNESNSEIKIITIAGETIIQNIKEGMFEVSTVLADNKYFFLTGKVYTPDKTILKNAAIKIYQIDNILNPPIITLAGVTFSDEYGTYGISLLTGKSYILHAFS